MGEEHSINVDVFFHSLFIRLFNYTVNISDITLHDQLRLFCVYFDHCKTGVREYERLYFTVSEDWLYDSIKNDDYLDIEDVSVDISGYDVMDNKTPVFYMIEPKTAGNKLLEQI